jgi:pilus assembly protein CpaF
MSFAFSSDNLEAETGDWRGLTGRIHRQFVAQSDIAAVSRLSRAALTEPVRQVVSEVLASEKVTVMGRQRETLIEAVISEIAGLGPLDALLADPEITEIMVNGPAHVYVERSGRLSPASVFFEDDAHIRRIMERIVAPLGRRIDEASPLCDSRLPDGSRVNCVIPPLAVRGPALTIRKFSPVPFVMEDLIRFGTLTPMLAEFLRACVTARLNILVSGGTGSGKTTTLNTLSGFIPSDERIVTIEDAAELQLQQDHVVALESRPPNLEGKGEITIRHLVRNALRMRPDRIVIGEVRGSETLDLLQAMNTGHDGSLSTVHANSPRDALSRLETLSLMAGTELPLRAVREQIAASVQLIVHQARGRDGTRRITHVTELHGMAADIIALQDVFRADVHSGAAQPTGLRPRVLELIEERGFAPPKLWG